MKYLIISFLLASAAWAQTPTFGSAAQTGAIINNAAATSTRPIAEKASAPATCVKGEQYFNTTSALKYLCTATDTWTVDIAGSLTTTGAIPYVTAAGTLGQDGARLFWDSTNYRLGIGTATPAQKLHIYGTSARVTLQATTVNQGAFFTFTQNNGTTDKTWQIGTDIETVGEIFEISKPGGGNAFAISQAGNVGIGTVSPASALHLGESKDLTISSDATTYGKIKGSVGPTYKYYSLEDGSGYSVIATYSGVRFLTNVLQEKMRLDINGNLGIGTVSPGALLHLKSGDVSAVLHFDSGTTTGQSANIKFLDRGTVAWNFYKDASNGLHLRDEGGTARTIMDWNQNSDMTINQAGKLLLKGAGAICLGPSNTACTATASVFDATSTTGSTTLVVKAGAGQSTNNLLSVTSNADASLFAVTSAGRIQDEADGYYQISRQGMTIKVYNGATIGWSSTAGANGTADLGLARASAGVLKVTDGSTGLGSITAKSFNIGQSITTTDRQLELTGSHHGSATTLYAGVVNPTFPSTTTAAAYGLYITPATAAASYTLTSAYGIYIEKMTAGSGSTITNNYGLYVKNGIVALGVTGDNVCVGAASCTAKLSVAGLATYADNTAALAGGLTAGAFYRTSAGVVMVAY